MSFLRGIYLGAAPTKGGTYKEGPERTRCGQEGKEGKEEHAMNEYALTEASGEHSENNCQNLPGEQ